MIAYALALVCAGAGGFLAWQHAIAPQAAVVVFAVAAAASYVWPRAWLVALPALIPVASFTPWTGSLAVEEIDLLALAFAAGAYARVPSIRVAQGDGARGLRSAPRWHLSIVAVVLALLFALSTAFGVYRGVVDAGGSEWSWYDGYYEAMNSVRIAKGYALALLYAPLLLDAMKKSEGRAADLLAAGLAVGAGVAALTVLWERYAFTGLLNFSSDYRATGLFWEMHVGGAALDGYLALVVPFVVWVLMRKSARTTAAAAILALLVSYACLATFSRGVYLAVPLSLALLFLLVAPAGEGGPTRQLAMLVKGVLAIVVAVAGSYLVFRAGGYRSLMAVLGVLALSLHVSTALRGAGWIEWGVAAIIGSVLAVFGVVAGSFLAKGPYLIYASAFALTAALFGLQWLGKGGVGRSKGLVILTLAVLLWTAFAGVDIARHWGGEAAQRDAAIVVALLVLLAAARARARAPLWPTRLREQGIVVASIAILAGAVAVMLGGAYMGERFATSEEDFEGRIQHWRDGLSLISTPSEWLAGKGVGRFPKAYYFGAPDAWMPGSYRIAEEGGNAFLVLAGPRHAADFGEFLRVGERVSSTAGSYTVTFDARAAAPARLHIEICQQHLLYNGACAFPSKPVTIDGRSWQTHVVTLDGQGLDSGAWYAPRLAFFSFGVNARGLRVDLDNVSLIGPGGQNLIGNGDFGNGMARWFMVSERIHLPWHIKSLVLNVLFDQGVIGLALFALLVGGALFRLVAGRARGHPLSPFIAASLAGFLIVGTFDSLLNVPRLAFAFYLVVFAGMALGTPTRVVDA